MIQPLGEYIRQVRLSKGLSLRQLAEKIGYRNLNRGIRRINKLEQNGILPAPSVLGRLVKVLGISHFALKCRLTLSDDARAGLDFCRPPFLFREGKDPGCLGCIEFPPKTVKTREQAEVYASQKGRRLGCEIWLVADAYTLIRFDENGVLVDETLSDLVWKRRKRRKAL